MLGDSGFFGVLEDYCNDDKKSCGIFKDSWRIFRDSRGFSGIFCDFLMIIDNLQIDFTQSCRIFKDSLRILEDSWRIFCNFWWFLTINETTSSNLTGFFKILLGFSRILAISDDFLTINQTISSNFVRFSKFLKDFLRFLMIFHDLPNNFIISYRIFKDSFEDSRGFLGILYNVWWFLTINQTISSNPVRFSKILEGFLMIFDN